MNFKHGLTLIVASSLTVLWQTSHAEYYWPNGFYVGAGASYGYDEIQSMSGSYGSNTSLRKKSMKKGKPGGILSLGYAPLAKPFRVDLSYEIIDKMDYNVGTVFTGGPYDLDSDLLSQAVFLNGYFDMPFSTKVLPYLTVGVGAARNKTDSNATDTGTSTSYKKETTTGGLAWQGGLGVRVKLTNNVVLDLGARHVDFGKAQWGPWGPSSTPAKIKAKDVFIDEGLAEITIFFGEQTPYQPPELMGDE